MKRMIRIALIALLMAGIFYLPGVTTVEIYAQKADQNITIVNKTGIEIFALFLSPNKVTKTGYPLTMTLLRLY